jgi:hypothetical protein
MRTRGARDGTAVAVACLAIVLAGCAAHAGPPEAAVPVPVPTVTVTVAPAPIPSPTPDPITCDTAFAPELLAQFEDDGLTFRGAEYTETVDTLAGDDGLRCRWGAPQSDLIAEYANWARDVAGWESLKSELLVAGYVETGPFAVEVPPVSDYTSAFSYRNGIVHYAAPARFIGWVSALQ